MKWPWWRPDEIDQVVHDRIEITAQEVSDSDD